MTRTAVERAPSRRRTAPVGPGVVRQRLVDRLDSASPDRLVLVSDAPGSGKTTALARWVAHRLRPVSWLRVRVDE